MRLHAQWDMLAALPYLALGAGLAWLAATLILRQIARLRRARKAKREEAGRRAAGPTPWHDWLRDINARSEQVRIDATPLRGKGKWRE